MTLHHMTAILDGDGAVTAFVCPVCGRRVNTAPFAIVEHGDRAALHSGGSGGIVMAATAGQDDPRLAPFAEWMSKHDE